MLVEARPPHIRVPTPMVTAQTPVLAVPASILPSQPTLDVPRQNYYIEENESATPTA